MRYLSKVLELPRTFWTALWNESAWVTVSEAARTVIHLMATRGNSNSGSKNDASVKRMQNECKDGEVMKLPD